MGRLLILQFQDERKVSGMKNIVIIAAFAALSLAAYAVGNLEHRIMDARRIAERMNRIGVRSIAIASDRETFTVVFFDGTTNTVSIARRRHR